MPASFPSLYFFFFFNVTATTEISTLSLHDALPILGSFMENLVEQYGNDMLRYKGVLAIKDNPQRLIVQGVHKVVGFDYGSSWQDPSEKISRLVVISRILPFDDLNQEFLKTIAS